ncbi:MAG: pyridoxal-phosphate dependent enzyme [bacterium]
MLNKTGLLAKTGVFGKKIFFTVFFAMVLLSFSFTISMQANPPLFDAYSKLKNSVPYVSLGDLETTPIIYVESLSQRGGAQFYVKDDGICGIDKMGKKIFAGNKRRKHEFLLADALAHGAKRIYTLGGAGSNHATATAAYARELGLACTLVLGPQRNTRYVQRNLKLDLFYGANIVACQTRQERTQTCKELVQRDPAGYFIPLGGSNKIGAIGYVNAAFELKKQIEQGLMPKPDVIYVTVSSAGMAAGLIVGIKAAGLDILVKPVRIDDTPEEIETELSHLIKEVSEYLYEHDSSFPRISIAPSQLNVINDIAGEEYVADDHARIARNCIFDAYALTTPAGASAIQELFQVTGIKLDGTYSGKAFAACLRDLKSGELQGKTVLFWDSFCDGDFSEYTSAVDTKKLPLELQKYIDEVYPIQLLDQGV